MFFFSQLNRNEYSQLIAEYKPLSLAHGFTDYMVSKYFTDTLATVANSPDCLLTQYTRGFVSLIMFVHKIIYL